MSSKIVFGQAYEPPLPSGALPLESSENGGDQIPVSASFLVFFVQDALSEAWEHVRGEPTLEQAGVLVGHPFVTFDGRTTFVVVAAVIPVEPGQAGAAHVVITPEGSARAREGIEQRYPGLKPVGWYHSHPGLGIFLSEADRVITNSIYDANWHLAVVFDPQANQMGIFRGPQQERLPKYFPLSEIPPTVEVMAAYNRAIAFQERGEWRQALNQLTWIQEMVETFPVFSDWQAQGGYRDVEARINDILSQIRGSMAEPGSSFPEMEGWEEDRETLDRLYNQGCHSMCEGDWQCALGYLEWIHSVSPGHREVEVLIEIARHNRACVESRRSRQGSSFRDLFSRLFSSR